MIKLHKYLTAGDIIKVEYGNYDSWVTVVVDKVIIEGNKYIDCNMQCHYLNGSPISIWGHSNDTVEVNGC